MIYDTSGEISWRKSPFSGTGECVQVGIPVDSTSGAWQKSTFSAESNCVGVLGTSQDVLITNSNQLERGALAFSPSAMAAWILGCMAGEFDDLGQSQ